MDNFDNKTYEAIAKEYHQALLQKKAIDHTYFLNHSEEQIRQIASNMLTSPYDYSHNWEDKFELPMRSQKMPEENFTKDSISSLLAFKKRKIHKMRLDITNKIKVAGEKKDDDKMMKYMKVKMKLDGIYNELAKQTNTVVLK